MSRLQPLKSVDVADETDAPAVNARQPQNAQPVPDQAMAIKMMLMALSALSQRAAIALAALFTLITATSAFYLWLIALPELNPTKIVGCTIYSIFVLLLNIYGRAK